MSSKPCLCASVSLCLNVFLSRGAQESAEDSLHRDLRRVQAYRRVLGVRGPQLDLRAEAMQTLQGRARAFDERDHYLAVASLRAVLYECYVAVADVLVYHRVARHLQGIDAVRAHAPQ